MGFFLLFSPELSNASCLVVLKKARELRNEAIEKVTTNNADAHTKVWLAYVDENTFEQGMMALTHLSTLIMNPNGQATPLFSRMISRPMGVLAFSTLTGEDMAHTLKKFDENDAVSFVLGAVIEKLFYFEENEAVIPSQKKFEHKSNEIAEFAARMEYLKNIQLDWNDRGATRLDQILKQYFYYFSTEGRFDQHSISMALKPIRWEGLWKKSSKDVDDPAQPLIGISQMIHDYKDPSAPGIAKYRPLDSLWDFYLTHRRKTYFDYYDRELRNLMHAAQHASDDMKAYHIADFFRGMDAFHIQFLLRASESQKHVFLVTMQHHLPGFLKFLSRDKNSIVIDGDLVSPKTFERIQRWCFKLEIEEPAYIYGSQTEDPTN